MNTIKVLIVDDSSFMRKIIKDILESEPDIQVIDTARNGKDALEKVIRLKPDVVTMDVEMPVMDGLAALKEFMENSPVPVVMVSSLTKEGAEVTLKALELGAVEFIAKPGGSISLKMDEIQDQIIEKVKIASSAKPRRNIVEKRIVQTPSVRKATPVDEDFLKKKKNVLPYPVILIGTSTGGPRALHKVMDDLSSNIKLQYLLFSICPQHLLNHLQ
jgi:two-component system chemotaxis response regulator CheB